MSKRYILIVGASSDIGCEIIKQISDSSSIILAHYRTGLEKLNNLKASSPAQIISIQADLATVEGISSLITSVASHCDVLHKMIFLAAPKLMMIRFKDVEWTDFQRHLEVELRTTFLLLKHFLPQMAKNHYGRVVFMLSSVTLGVPPAAMSHYVCSKYALQGLMKAAAAEYVAKGITVNAIAPSMVETNFLADIPEIMVKLAADNHPLKRNAHPKDIAPLVKYLLSDEAEYMTGLSIPVTGGMLY